MFDLCDKNRRENFFLRLAKQTEAKLWRKEKKIKRKYMMMWASSMFSSWAHRTAAAASDQFPENVLPDNFVIFIDVPRLVSPLLHAGRTNDISIELFYHSPSFIHLSDLSSPA